jgi:hypothetical protein
MAKLSPQATDTIAKLERLLGLEEREAHKRTEELYKGKSARELDDAGVLLRAARVVDASPALFGRVRIVVRDDPQRQGHVERFEARPGSVVRLMGRDDDGALEERASGVITRRGRGQLEAVFDDGAADAEGQIDILRAEDDVTLRRLRDGLRDAQRAEGRAARLVELVLGAAAPRPTRSSTFPMLDARLHEDQQIAVRHGVLAEDVALVHGPPGTGKTRVLVEIVRQCVARGERVLCLTASNAAVDHLALSVLAADPSISLARIGHPARVAAELEEHTLVALTAAHERRKLASELLDQAFRLLRTARRRSDRGREAWSREREVRAEAGKLFADARNLERQAARDVVERARVLCGTLTGFRFEVPQDLELDVLLVDEASQALTPALLLGAARVRRIVLAGDHKQLPPTVLSREAADGGLAVTAFEQLCQADTAFAISRMLTVQHRMHEELMAFPSRRFYGDKLTADPSVAQHTLRDLGVVDDDATAIDRVLDVIDTAGAGYEETQPKGSESRENAGEADVVARVVRGLVEGGLAPKQIGVLTPYSAQVGRIERQLSDLLDHGLEVDSVDGFQGREKEAVVFSAVRSNEACEVGFLADARRLNVAITRARRKLVVVGDSATLSADALWSAFFDDAIARGAHRSVFEVVPMT